MKTVNYDKYGDVLLISFTCEVSPKCNYNYQNYGPRYIYDARSIHKFTSCGRKINAPYLYHKTKSLDII
jgi:hypothetical protein